MHGHVAGCAGCNAYVAQTKGVWMPIASARSGVLPVHTDNGLSWVWNRADAKSTQAGQRSLRRDGAKQTRIILATLMLTAMPTSHHPRPRMHWRSPKTGTPFGLQNDRICGRSDRWGRQQRCIDIPWHARPPATASAESSVSGTVRSLHVQPGRTWTHVDVRLGRERPLVVVPAITSANSCIL